MRTFIAICSFLFVSCGFAIFYANLFDSEPAVKTFYDRHGAAIGSLHTYEEGRQLWTTYQDIPPSIVRQTLLKEDRFFFWHVGVNPYSIIRAAIQNIKAGHIVHGGSTITQQLAKNLITAQRGSSVGRTWGQKMREAFVALGLELLHSKEWILERYLNTVYYGHRCYGIAAAAKYYFGKSLNDLSEQEIDLLTALPKAPNYLSQEVMSRRARHHAPNVGRHFIEFAHSKAQGNPVINTTLDYALQSKLEGVIKASFNAQVIKDPLLNAAAVVLDVPSGDILAMVGSRDYQNKTIDGQFNAALARRQPGSTLKPFTYFAAFSKGFSGLSLVPDEPLSFYAQGNPDALAYIPQNFDRRYHGQVTIREALANSYNVPAVVTLNEIGLSYYHNILKKFGFSTFNEPLDHYGLSITLGSGEVSLLELTNAYAALARGGEYLPYRAVKDELIPEPLEIISRAKDYAQEVTRILSDTNARLKAFGYNEAMNIEDHLVAVKTGTSHKRRDNWMVGYTSDYAVGVWVGHADGSPLLGTTGASGAGPTWHAVMEKLVRGEKGRLGTRDKGRGTIDHGPLTIDHITSRGDQSIIHTRQKKTRSISQNNKHWRVVSPLPHVHYRINPYVPEKHQKILVEARAGANGHTPLQLNWALNGVSMGESSFDSSGIVKLWISPRPGKHRLEVRGTDGVRYVIPFVVDLRLAAYDSRLSEVGANGYTPLHF
jgi:penicillin-binding protein 1C